MRIVAIDGVMGSGKSTVARLLAPKLGLEYLDTGAMYRCVALAAIREAVDIQRAADSEGHHRMAVVSIARRAVIEVATGIDGEQVVRLDGEVVSGEIRSAQVSAGASLVARIAEVRAEMVQRQRSWAHAKGGGVLEGRDIASAVFPDAETKIFLTASAEERAARRHQQHPGEDYEAVLADLHWRDASDMERAADPLKVVEGAHVVDTTGKSVDEVVQLLRELADGDLTNAPIPVAGLGTTGVSSSAVPSGVLASINQDLTAGPCDQVPLHPASAPPPAAGSTIAADSAPETISTPASPLSGPSQLTDSTPTDPAARSGSSALQPTVSSVAHRVVGGPATPRQMQVFGATRLVVVPLIKWFFKVDYSGLPNVPATGGFILAPSHRSNVDFALMPGVTKRRMRFLGKDTIWKYRFLAGFFDSLGGIPVKRGTTDRESMRICSEVLDRGEGIVVFPEGSRRSGKTVENLFDGAAFLAAKHGVPIIPVGIGNSESAMPKGQKMPQRVRIKVIVGQPIKLEKGAKRSAIKAATSLLQSTIQALFDEANVS